MKFKDGCDGAGQQVVWNSVSMNGFAHNMFQYGLAPLQLDGLIKRDGLDETSTILWKNPAPNSALFL